MTIDRAPRRPLRPTTKALPEDARRHNRSLVLQTLFRGGPMSRADLARLTHLTRVTTSELVGELLDAGLLVDLGTRTESRVGKPATLVGIRQDAAEIVSLDLSDSQQLRGALVDLTGTVTEHRSVPWGSRTGADALSLVQDLAAELKEVADRPVLGVGVGSPGVVDPRGVVVEAPNLDWYGLDLAADLGTFLQLPVHVANDANASALGEHTFGGSTGSGLLVVTVGQGVGAGLLLDGGLLLGDHFAAGEIGHVMVVERGETCACGRQGCLETVLAAPLLRARLASASTADRHRVLTSAGRRLGGALAPVVSTLNLGEVVLSGPADLLDGPLRDATVAELRRRTLPVVADHLTVRLSLLGEDLVLAGAAVLVLTGELGVS
ncbi:MAG TPA: ROK family transcriptional regulator [Actinomycetales bacterium]|nr:ROK family transcriptional regulator [Actinomycetales bacterium]